MSRPVAALIAGAVALATGGIALAQAPGPHPTVGSVEIHDPKASAWLGPDPVIEKLTDDEFGWSEGPVWMADRGEVLFTDVPGNTLYRWTEESGLEIALRPSGPDPKPDGTGSPGANGLIADGPDAILMAVHGDRNVVRLDLGTMTRTVLADRFEGERFNSPNDLVRASDGSLYFTDPPYGLAGGDGSAIKDLSFNGVYRLDSDGEVVLLDDTLSRPNGIALSPDERTVYVAQSDREAAILFAYDRADDGSLSNRRVLSDFTAMVVAGEPGLPDGMVVTREGMILLAGPGGIHLLSPEGERLGLIRTGTAAANVTLDDTETTIWITSGPFLARVVRTTDP